MKAARILICIGVLTILVAGPAGAQPPSTAPPPLALTFDEALARGLEQSPRLAEARAQEAAADAMVTSRAALARPSVTASAGYLRTNHVEEFGIVQPTGVSRIIFPDIPANYRVRAEMSVPIYTSGRVDALVEGASAEARAAAAGRLATEQDVTLDVGRAYWALVTARAEAGVVAQALARMDAYVADVGARVDAGILPPNEVLTARAERARQAVRRVRADQAAALAGIVLARLLGLPLDQSIEPTTPVEQPLPGAEGLVEQPVASLVARAMEQRDERRQLQARAAAALAGGRAARAALKPQVSAVAAVEPARPNNRFVPRADEWRTSWDLGVNVTWPLWDGGRARADHAAASAQADAIGHRLRELDASISIEVRARVMAVTAGRGALEAAAQGVEAATEAHRVLSERFAAGVATSTEVLDGQVALLEAEVERTRLLAAQRLAEAELLRTLGAG
jgi:outer membrane protein TolC